MKRVNLSVTSRYEEAILKRIVPHIPQWISPDMLTFFALLSSIFAGVCYLYFPKFPGLLLGASFFIFLNWLTDSTDGKVAIYRKISRPNYGIYVDHFLDTFTAVALAVGMSVSAATLTNSWYFFLTFTLIANVSNYLKMSLLNEFYLSVGGMSATDARLILIAMNLLMYFYGNNSFTYFGYTMTFLDFAGIVLAVMTFAIVMKDFFQTARFLHKKDSGSEKWN